MSENNDFYYEIKPKSAFTFGIKELLAYRELFYFFTWRDVKVKYKQTFLGIFWAILQPIFLMLIFTFFFGKKLNIDTNGIPYPLFVFSGLILWNVFSSGITNAGNSMVTNSNIIKKIYFPRLIIPISSILSSIIDFGFAFIVFVGLLIWYGFPVDPLKAILYWSAGVLLTCLGTFGPGCLLAALNIKYRDFRFALPFLVQTLLFLTPVIYPVSVTTKSWLQTVMALNPMYAAIEIFRAPLGGLQNPTLIMISIGSSVAFFVLGLGYFKKTEMYFADLA